MLSFLLPGWLLSGFYIFCITLVVLTSYILHQRLAGHSLAIGRISLPKLALYDVKYSGVLYGGTYHFTFTAESISFCFHIPTPTLPQWFTFTSEGIFYTSDTSDISTDNLSATLWIFPVLFRQTAGPWCNVQMDGLKLRVQNGKSTPYLIKRLRENLVGAIVCGEIFRMDDFGTKVSFMGLTESAVEEGDEMTGPKTKVPEGETVDCIGSPEGKLQDGPPRMEKNLPQSFLPSDEDELRISAFVRGLHLYNTEGHVYTFGSVDAQFRRNWTADRGSFVMIAKECRWIRVHWPYQRIKVIPSWMQLLSAVVQFPRDLVHALHYPMTAVNLYVTELDITFDEFRIRDAELVTQAMSLLQERMHLRDIHWQDVLADALAEAILGTCT
ncbi:unnamed protein product [Somion occarium]|uniref:Uncharacterized protein n=1 Tax=Somion occarium TaxID=3059160 RepID=A0ABP1CEL3_9APHY